MINQYLTVKNTAEEMEASCKGLHSYHIKASKKPG